jgi:hypothetical protein
MRSILAWVCEKNFDACCHPSMLACFAYKLVHASCRTSHPRAFANKIFGTVLAPCTSTTSLYNNVLSFRPSVSVGVCEQISLEYSTSLVCRPASPACVGEKFIRHVRSSFHFRMHALNSCTQTDADEKGRQDAPNNLFSSACGMEGQQARGARNLLSVSRLNHRRCTVTLNFKLQPCIHVKLKHQMCIFLFLKHET